MHSMRVRKVVVVGSHGQCDDHGGDRGSDRGGKTDATAKVEKPFFTPSYQLNNL